MPNPVPSPEPTPAPGLVYEFREFRLDCGRFELMRNSRELHVERKPMELLILLASREGQLVTRQEIAERLWSSEVFVDTEHGINTAIRKIRQVLRDNPEQPRFLQTVSGMGYRFIAPIHTLPFQQHTETNSTAEIIPGIEDSTETPMPALPVTASEALPSAPARPKKRLAAASSVALVVLILALAFWFLRPALPHPVIASLAVLPLDNLSGNPDQDYFADGMTDELITELAHISTLRVVSRTSVISEKGLHKPLQQIARDLNVDAIVEGSIVRSGDRIRITAQLIDARSDKHLWAQSFEGSSSDVLSLQDNVAREIAAQTKAALAPDARANISGSRHVDPAAHDAYLRGRYFLEKRELKKSVAYFQQAVAIDPQWSQANSGLADALHAAGLGELSPDKTMIKAESTARHAIELDPANGEAYSTLGAIQATFEWNWAEAEQNIRRGIALSPGSSDAELDYAILLDAVNRPEEAVTHMRRALELDPLSFLMNRHLGSTLFFARHYEEALAHLEHAAEMEPGNLGYVLGWESGIYEAMGKQDKAVDLELKLLSLAPAADARLRSIYALRGWKAYWRERLKMDAAGGGDACAAYGIALDYIRIGQPDQAFLQLNRAIDQKCDAMIWIKVTPSVDSIRADPRFNDLLKRLNLPQ
jgi:TolB-like protein/DNA-binding winged helix-turn-helix (wHTH) protein/Tfp pilus assembly protein PilF